MIDLLNDNFIKSKPQIDLENISFFQLSKSYHLIPTHKYHPLQQNKQFSRWADKDQQFFNYIHNHNHQNYTRKQSADSIPKRMSYQKFKLNHSVTFHTNKINLGSKLSQSIHKYHSTSKSKSLFTPHSPKFHFESRAKVQYKNVNSKYNQGSRQIQKRRQNIFAQNPQKKSELQTQSSYNFINYPISTVIRKRKYKKLQKCPFPSLAQRLNK